MRSLCCLDHFSYDCLSCFSSIVCRPAMYGKAEDFPVEELSDTSKVSLKQRTSSMPQLNC
jgi:hypothetical protein